MNIGNSNALKFIKDKKLSIFRTLLIIESILLLIFSLVPGEYMPAGPGIPPFKISDIEHVISYFVYGILLGGSIVHKNSRNRLIYILIIGSAFGMLTETIQGFVPNRYPDFKDWSADVLGVLVGGLASIKFSVFSNRDQHPSSEQAPLKTL